MELGELQIIDRPATLKPTVVEFLEQLGRPTLIRIPGHDSSRCRAICTLLHGNEPSGLIAVHRWLLKEQVPAVNILLFIGAVQTALTPPQFSFRQIPGRRDLNRCFRQPFADQEGRIAKGFLDELLREQPECLIDVHNTSGEGPSFCISITNDAAHQALASLFSSRFIINHLRMGALMEYSEGQVPTITVECGGARDPAAHECAYEGLLRYLQQTDVLTPNAIAQPLEIMNHPVRLELVGDASLAFHSGPLAGFDLVLPPDIDRFNFGLLPQGQPLGWLGGRGLDIFRVWGPRGEDLTPALLTNRNGALITTQALKSFMITTNPVIAKSDCLFYAVKPDGAPLF